MSTSYVKGLIHSTVYLLPYAYFTLENHIIKHIIMSFVSLSTASSKLVLTVDGTHMPPTRIGFWLSPKLTCIYLIFIIFVILFWVFLLSVNCLILVIQLYFFFIYCHENGPHFERKIETVHRQVGIYVLPEMRVIDIVASTSTSNIDLSSFPLNFSTNSFYL